MFEKKDIQVGLYLATATIALFLGVNYFLLTDRYFDYSPNQFYYASLLCNLFVIPFLYTTTVIYTLYRKGLNVSGHFMRTLRSSLVIQILAGGLSMLFIWYFMNNLDMEASKEFSFQYVQVNKGNAIGGDTEVEDVMNIEKNLNLNFFNTAYIWTKIFPVIILFYLMISVIVGLFYRTKQS